MTCPHCKKKIEHALTVQIPLVTSPGQAWRGLAHCCPACDVMITVEVDTYVLRDAINEAFYKLSMPAPTRPSVGGSSVG
jgi:copper chaperone CopZ